MEKLKKKPKFLWSKTFTADDDDYTTMELSLELHFNLPKGFSDHQQVIDDIHKCINSHDALVEACKDAFNYLDTYGHPATRAKLYKALESVGAFKLIEETNGKL